MYFLINALASRLREKKVDLKFPNGNEPVVYIEILNRLYTHSLLVYISFQNGLQTLFVPN